MGRAKDLQDDSVEYSVFTICVRRLQRTKTEILVEVQVMIVSGAEYSLRYSPTEGAIRRFLMKAHRASEGGLLVGRMDVYIETRGTYCADVRIPVALIRFAERLEMPIQLVRGD